MLHIGIIVNFFRFEKIHVLWPPPSPFAPNLRQVSTRGGTGMKNQVLVGYRVFKKIKYGSSWVSVHVKLYQKTLASLAKCSIDTKVWNKYVFDNAKLSMATEFFSIFIMCQASNQSILSLRLASTTADPGRVLRSRYPYSWVDPKYPFQP